MGEFWVALRWERKDGTLIHDFVSFYFCSSISAVLGSRPFLKDVGSVTSAELVNSLFTPTFPSRLTFLLSKPPQKKISDKSKKRR